MQRLSLFLCVSLIVWFCTFSSQCFMYSLFIISILSVKNNGAVDFFLVWGLVLMCSLMCEKVKQDRFQLLLSFFPSPFSSLCLQVTLYISKNTLFHVFLGVWIAEWQISIWVFWNISPFPVFLCFHWSMVRSHIHGEDNLVIQPQQSSQINISFLRDFMNMGHELRLLQLWQSKLCCLTVGVLALSQTRPVCLANKGKTLHSSMSSSLLWWGN